MLRWTRRIGIAALGSLALTLVAVAQPPAATPDTPADLRSPQEQNADLFRKFQRELLFLAQKLEKSDRAEEKERAKVIFAALDLAKTQGVETQFQKMIAGFAKGGGNLQQLDSIAGQDKQLQKALRDIMTVLMTDDAATRLKAERESIEKLLAETREILRQQKTVRGMTEAKRVDAERIARDQEAVTERTQDLAKKMGGDPKEKGKPGEKAIAKSEPKGEAKPGEDAADAKPETGESKSEDKAGPPKDGDANGEPKPADPKDAAGKSKPGDPKAGDPKGGDPKGGDPKGGDPKGGEPKGGEPKPGSPKAGEPKPNPDAKEPKDAPKPGESKNPEQGKAEAKSSEPKPGDPPPAAGKPMTPKGDTPSAQAPPSQPKGDGEPGEPGEPGGSPPPAGPKPEEAPGRKQVKEAMPFQKEAKKGLEAKKRDDAAKQQDEAIKKLAAAAEELEKRLKQLREEEQLGLLANLEARCGRMLAMQIEVWEATKAIDGVVVKNKGVKDKSEIQKSQQQADKEAEIVKLADGTLKLLESEGSAVAFARVLEEVRVDMASVQRRLNDTYVGRDTQAIEENVVAMLREMVAALKKAQEEVKAKQGQPPPPPGAPRKPGDKSLLELVTELKLIRSLQIQVNGRTKVSAAQYEGEQASDPIVQAELRQLADRQAKLQGMVNDIATGKNK
jgi:hypothetical protein